MSDLAKHLLVADVPAGTAVHQVSHALMRSRFHHVSDTIGPVVRLWVYCVGDPHGARSTVRHIIEAALADQSTPMPVVFADEQQPAAPLATRPRSPIHGSSPPAGPHTDTAQIRHTHGEPDQREAVDTSLRKAG